MLSGPGSELSLEREGEGEKVEREDGQEKIPTPTIIEEKNKIYTYIYILQQIIGPRKIRKTHPHSTLQAPTTQLAKMSIDPKFVELTADVLNVFL